MIDPRMEDDDADGAAEEEVETTEVDYDTSGVMSGTQKTLVWTTAFAALVIIFAVDEVGKIADSDHKFQIECAKVGSEIINGECRKASP